MSTPERIARIPEQDEESSSRQEANVSIATRPRTHRRTRRFEIGFFIRKVVNGWIALYKAFPPSTKRYTAPSPPAVPTDGSTQSEGGSDVPRMAMATSSSTANAGAGKGAGDGGPVGETRVEIGFFLTSTVESTDDDADDSCDD